MNVHGILTCDAPDVTGEELLTAGVDLERLNQGALVTWGMPTGRIEDVIGRVLAAWKVESPDDYRCAGDRGLAEAAGWKPFVHVVCRLFERSPEQQSFVADVRGLASAEHIWFGAYGHVLERSGHRLLSTKLEGVGLVLHPVNRAYRVLLGEP